MPKAPSATSELDAFIARFTPEVAKVARAALQKLRARYPSADFLVYDNYNALAIGLAPGERASDVVFSLALYPRYASLFFFQNAHRLKDPQKRLRGTGRTTRHVVLKSAEDLDDPAIGALMEENLARAKLPFAASGKGRLVIKSVSAKQRPRRP